jgi:hypothetical protein
MEPQINADEVAKLAGSIAEQIKGLLVKAESNGLLDPTGGEELRSTRLLPSPEGLQPGSNVQEILGWIGDREGTIESVRSVFARESADGNTRFLALVTSGGYQILLEPGLPHGRLISFESVGDQKSVTPLEERLAQYKKNWGKIAEEMIDFADKTIG